MLTPQKADLSKSSSADWEAAKLGLHVKESLGGVKVERPAVVVTGVSTGIGYGIAKFLIARGCHIFGSVRKEKDALRLAADFETEAFTPLLFDVTEESAVKKAAAQVASCMQGRTLMGLVNNAGMHVGFDALAVQPMDTIRKQIEVNLLAQITVIQAFLPQLGTDLTLKGRPGKILNVSSVLGSYAVPFATAYCTSKAGLNALSEGLRRELKPFRIDVVVIAPGPIQTEIWGKVQHKAEVVAQKEGIFAEQVQKAQRWCQSMENMKPGRIWGPSKVGDRVYKVLKSKRSPLHVVVTPQWWLNWFLPTTVPRRIVDIDMFHRFKMRPVARLSA